MSAIERTTPTVNFHLWEPCNMRCGFCFATFQDVKRDVLPKGHMERDACVETVDLLARAGFAKINFAGGEPTLCPWLLDLVQAAKRRGLATSIVTNGSRITDEWLAAFAGSLDWVALSVDTVDPDKLRLTGRALNGKPISEEDYLSKADAIVESGIRLKINTVVTAQTWEEDFSGFIRRARPERWKILQVLPVAGQNDDCVGDYTISRDRFDRYVARNRVVERDGITVVPECNEMMTGSYVMVDPAGRFFDNVGGEHAYSRPILEVGVEAARSDVTVDARRFAERGGIYEW